MLFHDHVAGVGVQKGRNLFVRYDSFVHNIVHGYIQTQSLTLLTRGGIPVTFQSRHYFSGAFFDRSELCFEFLFDSRSVFLTTRVVCECHFYLHNLFEIVGPGLLEHADDTTGFIRNLS